MLAHLTGVLVIDLKTCTPDSRVATRRRRVLTIYCLSTARVLAVRAGTLMASLRVHEETRAFLSALRSTWLLHVMSLCRTSAHGVRGCHHDATGRRKVASRVLENVRGTLGANRVVSHVSLGLELQV